MRFDMITNLLLRLNCANGTPPPPFERTNEGMDFWILELGQHQDVGGLHSCVEQALHRHVALLRRLRQEGTTATLFVEKASSLHVLRLESSFIELLSEFGVALEFFCHDYDA